MDSHLHPYVGKQEYHCDMNWYEPELLSARKQMRIAYNTWKDDKQKLLTIGEENYTFLKSLELSYSISFGS